MRTISSVLVLFLFTSILMWTCSPTKCMFFHPCESHILYSQNFPKFLIFWSPNLRTDRVCPCYAQEMIHSPQRESYGGEHEPYDMAWCSQNGCWFDRSKYVKRTLSVNISLSRDLGSRSLFVWQTVDGAWVKLLRFIDDVSYGDHNVHKAYCIAQIHY